MNLLSKIKSWTGTTNAKTCIDQTLEIRDRITRFHENSREAAKQRRRIPEASG
jgi:hypothetical protein